MACLNAIDLQIALNDCISSIISTSIHSIVNAITFHIQFTPPPPHNYKLVTDQLVLTMGGQLWVSLLCPCDERGYPL